MTRNKWILSGLLSLCCAASLTLATANLSDHATAETPFETVSIDFGTSADGSQFTTGWGGWEVKDGKFVPSVGWGSTYLHTAIPFGTETVTISLDFYFEESANNPELWIGLVDDAGKVPTDSTGDGVSLRLSASGEGLYTAFSGNYGQWITETDEGFAGAKHTVQMVFTADKKVTVTVDGNALSHSAAGLTMTNIGYAAKYDFDSAFLSFKSVGTNNYVDNISIQVGESNGEQPGGSGGEVEIPEDVSIDFESSTVDSLFMAGWMGWSIQNGKLMPVTGWASAYLNTPISFGVVDVTVSLDFYFEESENYPELSIGLVDDATKVPTESTGDGVTLRLSKTGEGLFTAFSGNYGQWLTETDEGFAGAKHTVQMVFTADKKVTVTVDGNALSHSAAGLTMTNIGYAAKYDFDSAFLSFKSVGTNNYVDNISITYARPEVKTVELPTAEDDLANNRKFVGYVVSGSGDNGFYPAGTKVKDVADLAYGYYTTSLYSKTFEGQSGMFFMESFMKDLRENPLTEVCGKKIIQAKDYVLGLDGLPKSNVISFFGEDFSLIIRPSGTEPKMKVYITAQAETKKDSLTLLGALEQEVENLLDKN